MKLQRSTVGLAVAAMVMAGGYLVYDQLIQPKQESIQAEEKDLFDFEEQDVTQVQIATTQYTVDLVRSPQPSPSPVPTATGSPAPSPAPSPEASPAPSPVPSPPPPDWKLTSPITGPANDGNIAFLLSQLSTGSSDQTWTIAPDRLQEFGLKPPAATVTITLKDGTTHRLVLGAVSFDGANVYAQVDPPGDGEQTVVLLPISFEEAAVSRALEDWQAPPAPDPDTPGDPGAFDPGANPGSFPLPNPGSNP